MDLQTYLRKALHSENLSASELARRSQFSQASISRALTKLPVIRLGAGRNSVFAWVDAPEGHPLYTVDDNGQPTLLAHLYRQPVGHVLVLQNDASTRFDDIPWYLQSALPAGYLGRWHVERLSQTLQLSANPARWTSNEAFRYLLEAGDQLPGNLLVGKLSAQRYLNAYQPLSVCSPADYPQLAQDRLQHGFNVSSVAGEQPKFLAYVAQDTEAYHAIVKFSPPLALKSAAAQRYRDLLVAEHLALTYLREQGIAAASTRLLELDRFYLEIRRFDRVGEFGRRGMVNLQELEAEFIGSSSHWHEAADSLYRLGMIDGDARHTIHLLSAFGHFIANTDMHFGNLAFYFEDLQLRGLAPVYDMLPMFFMPVRDEIVERAYLLKPLLGVDAEVLAEARGLARGYWQRVVDNGRISAGFRGVAQQFLRDTLT